jgi:hypothetical protein
MPLAEERAARPARPPYWSMLVHNFTFRLSLLTACVAAVILAILVSFWDPRQESHSGNCFDSQNHVMVGKEQCPGHCCVRKSQDCKTDYCEDDRQRYHEAEYCGSEDECDQQQNAYMFQRNGIIVIFVVVILGLCICVKLSVDADQQHFCEQQKASKQREIDIVKKLDSEFPPTMYGKPDDLEQHRQSSELCCICLEELEQTIVRKLHCSHVVHQSCFDRWCLHLSDPDNGSVPKWNRASVWACPLCKHPATPETST